MALIARLGAPPKSRILHLATPPLCRLRRLAEAKTGSADLPRSPKLGTQLEAAAAMDGSNPPPYDPHSGMSNGTTPPPTASLDPIPRPPGLAHAPRSAASAA